MKNNRCMVGAFGPGIEGKHSGFGNLKIILSTVFLVIFSCVFVNIFTNLPVEIERVKAINPTNWIFNSL